MNCSLSFSTKTSVFFLKNALVLNVSVGRPFACFESVSFPCFSRICFPVRKLTLHAWWYRESAACRSCANPNFPRTVSAHSSLLTLQTCCILSSSFVHTGITSALVCHRPATEKKNKKKQCSLKTNVDVVDRRANSKEIHERKVTGTLWRKNSDHNCSTVATIILQPYKQAKVDDYEVEQIRIYSGRSEESLDSLRYSKFCLKITTGTSFVQPECLPITFAAAVYYSHRVYH